VGSPTKVKVVKNKLAPPFRVATFDIVFGEGISKTGEIIDLGVDCDVIQKSGSWFSYEGTKIAQGREQAKQFLHDNPEVAEQIELKIKEKYSPALAPETSESSEGDED
jgi:recombination protein RecA